MGHRIGALDSSSQAMPSVISSGLSSTCIQVSEMKVFHLNKYKSGITMATRNTSFLRWKK